MTEVAQVATDNLHLVRQIPQMVSEGIAAEDHWTLLAIFNKQTHHFQTDEPRSAGNECRHEMNVSFHCCSMSPRNGLVSAAYAFRQLPNTRITCTCGCGESNLPILKRQSGRPMRSTEYR